ncbi:HigA family addiction module antidote protein [Pseudomonas sp. WS 5018]|nr:HigA family addiction module antidote protein [Pseudomonas sp. WS 5018]
MTRFLSHPAHLEPLGITPATHARARHVSAPTIDDSVRERRSITADTAIRLGHHVDTSAQFRMNLQSDYALATAYATSGEEIEQEIGPLKVAGNAIVSGLASKVRGSGLWTQLNTLSPACRGSRITGMHVCYQ